MSRFDREIPAESLRQYLPVGPNIPIAVTFSAENRNAAFVGTVSDVITLALYGMVGGILRKDRLRHVFLTVQRDKALRTIHQCLVGSESRPLSISRKHQDRGAKRWVKRYDRADGGVIGGMRTLHIGLGWSNSGLTK